MKKKEFEELIIAKIPKLYHFSYSLIPDDLQAQQIVIDAFTILTISEKESFKSFLFAHAEGAVNWDGPASEKDVGAEKHRGLNEILFKNCFKLGHKRYFQLRESVHFENSSKGKFGAFYLLEIRERAILFLRDKTDFSIKQMGSILGLKENETMMLLNTARMKFVRLLGYEHENFLEA